MPRLPLASTRAFRNASLYRSMTRTLRVYNRRVIEGVHALGFADFQPSFPGMLSNLDTSGTRIGVLAARAGVTRQAAGQLLRQIERCGYITLTAARDDARATIVRYTPRGKKLIAAIIDLATRIERDLSAALPPGEFDRMRSGLVRVADRVDPVGTFGSVDRR